MRTYSKLLSPKRPWRTLTWKKKKKTGLLVVTIVNIFTLLLGSLFSGHVDPGESEFETALRETEEEAGLPKEQLNILDSFQSVLHYEAHGKPKKVIYWLSELKDPSFPVTLSEEHTDFKWLPLEEACRLLQFKDMEKAVRDADNFISKVPTNST